jgi:uncharacterized protein YaaQ
MTLVVAIVQREDAGKLTGELSRRGHRATRISASGGFLSVGNDVILSGVADQLVPDVLDAIKVTCETRTAYAFHLSGDFAIDGTSMPIEVEVGGAVVFTLPVERYVQLTGRVSARSGAGGEARR